MADNNRYYYNSAYYHGYTETSDEPEHPSASFAQPQEVDTQHTSHPGSQAGMFSEQMTSHHVPHMTQSIPHQVQDDIRYQLPRKQIENSVPQGSMYIQHAPDHTSTHNQGHSNIHMPNEGHNQSHPNNTSNLQHNPNYPYYYQQPQHQYHHHNMHGNVPPHQQQQPSMQIYAQQQNHPNYSPPPTAPHLRYPQLPQNTPLYSLTTYSVPEVDQHPPMNPYYQYPPQDPSNVAPHLLHNPPKLAPESKSKDKGDMQHHMQQPYKKIATPKTPPTSVSPTLTKRKRTQAKDESNSSRADGEEDGNTSVDQALTDDSDSVSGGVEALSSDDSYEERRRKKKRRKVVPSKPKEQGNVVPEKYQLPDPGLIEQTKAILKEYSISQKVLAHQLPASETMVSLWMNGSKKLIGWQDLETKVRDWLRLDHQRPEKQHIVNFIDETTRVKQRLDSGFK
jgi:hypothetical protein